MYQIAAGTQREKALPVILGLGLRSILTCIFECEARGGVFRCRQNAGFAFMRYLRRGPSPRGEAAALRR